MYLRPESDHDGSVSCESCCPNQTAGDQDGSRPSTNTKHLSNGSIFSKSAFKCRSFEMGCSRIIEAVEWKTLLVRERLDGLRTRKLEDTKRQGSADSYRYAAYFVDIEPVHARRVLHHDAVDVIPLAL